MLAGPVQSLLHDSRSLCHFCSSLLGLDVTHPHAAPAAAPESRKHAACCTSPLPGLSNTGADLDLNLLLQELPRSY